MKTKVGLTHEPSRQRPWVVYWWSPPDFDTGKQAKRKKSFKYKRDAQAFQAERQAEINTGDPECERTDIKLDQLLDEFRQARLEHLSHKSRECYDATMGRVREHFGGNCLIGHIRQRHAEAFMSSLERKDGRRGRLASWSRYQHLKHARAIFGAAVDWGYIARSPFVPIRQRGNSALRVKGKSRPWHHVTPEEFRRLLSGTSNVRRRAMYWLMYGCGLRPGEVYNLTVGSIDLSSRRVHVQNRAATPDVPPFTVKCDDLSDESKERSVPIPAAAVSDLTEGIRQSFKSGGFIALSEARFTTVQTNWQKCREGQPWGCGKHHRAWQNRDMLINALRDAKADLKRAGVELTAPFTLNTFRKSFAQNHADNGTHPRTLAKLLGHSSTRMTMQFYNRVTDANERAAAATVDKLFTSEFPQSSPKAGSEEVA